MVDVRISISVVHGSDLELPKKGGLGLRSTVRALYRIESKGTACKAGNFQLTDRLFRHSVLASESVIVWSVCGLSQCSSDAVAHNSIIYRQGYQQAVLTLVSLTGH
ncbi:hypothetical protein FOYG_03150 [Fusarium oxysporum NRRL 32931]|uniref:Uncharacterized protein n=1 Tax=Fusarium oxysporum NRRL 32931 TaxID=660029 RepID=W9J256_FUSOX|nr:hypothetical protein FOYG_03150 [Fusarium oxysporum NRRL 32931]